MNQLTQIWILGGALGVLLAICGFLVVYWFRNTNSKLDLLLTGQYRIEIENVKLQKDMEFIRGDILKMNDRFNLHGKRLHELEQRKAS